MVQEPALTKEAHFKRGAVTTVKDEIRKALFDAIARVIDENGRIPLHDDLIIVESRIVFLGFAVDFVRDREDKEPIGLQEFAGVFKRPLDWGRDVFEHIG